MSERRDAALAKQARGEKLLQEEMYAAFYRCDIDPEHEPGDFASLMHVTKADGSRLPPHRAKVCGDCYVEQFKTAQQIPFDTSDRELAACRIPADAPLPTPGVVAFEAQPNLADLLKSFSAEEIEAALADRG